MYFTIRRDLSVRVLKNRSQFDEICRFAYFKPYISSNCNDNKLIASNLRKQQPDMERHVLRFGAECKELALRIKPLQYGRSEHKTERS